MNHYLLQLIIKEILLKTTVVAWSAVVETKVLFLFCYLFQGKGKWKLWSDELSSVPPIPRDIPVNQIIVQTVETVCSIAVIMLLVTHNKPVMFVGPTGTGKSSYITVSV